MQSCSIALEASVSPFEEIDPFEEVTFHHKWSPTTPTKSMNGGRWAAVGLMAQRTAKDGIPGMLEIQFQVSEF